MKKLLFALFIIVLAGCVSTDPGVYVELERLEYSTAGLEIGMPRARIIELYGEPDDINKTVLESSIREQFVYDQPDNERLYIYVENGELTAWQE